MTTPAILSSVPNVNPYIQYVATNGQTVFPYPFPLTQDSDLIVIVNGVTQATDQGYTLSGVGSTGGGNLTFTLGRVTGDVITMYRNIAIQRITQITQNSGYASSTFNAEYNNIYLILQQLQESISLCLQIPSTNSPSPTTSLLPSNYANKYLAFDANGNPTPAVLTSSGAVTQALVAGFINPQTPVEISLGIVPANLRYAPGVVERYGSNTTPGTTDMTVPFQKAVNVARAGPGVDVVWGATAPYMLTDTIDCTFATALQQYGITFRQVGNPGVNFPPSTSGGLYINHNKYTCFDLTGCSMFAFYDLTAVTNNGGTYPKTMFLTARNSTGESNFPRFFNTKAVGHFSVGVLYNYGSEDGLYTGNVWENYATDAGASCIVITSGNLWQGNVAFMSSAFVTIATGPQSTIGHAFIGGDYAVLQASTTSDVFYLEGGVDGFHFSKGWMDCSNAATNGRSFLRADCTTATPFRLTLDGIHSEIASTQPTYGLDISNHVGTGAIGWSIRDCLLQSSTYAVHSPNASALCVGWAISNMMEQSTKGINISGTLQDSTIDYAGTTILNVSLRNVLITNFSNLTIGTRTNDVLIDRSTGSIYTRQGIGMWGNAPAGQLAGWGTPTAGAVVNNFPGSGATLGQCGQVLTELILQLKSLGLLGA